MTMKMRCTNGALAAVLLALPWLSSAQAPPRPSDIARGVTLSLVEYNRLVDLATRSAAAAPLAPVAAVLASSDLRVRVDGSSVRGVITLGGETLRPGLSRVNLISGATLVNATTQARPLPLLSEGDTYSAILSGPGPFDLALEWGSPLTLAPGRASFVMPVPQSGAARATIDIPGEQADVHLSTGVITRRAAANGRTVIEATLDPGAATTVWWSMRDSVPLAATREVRTLADVLTLLSLGEADVRMVALVDITVLQGELRSLALRLPPGYELAGVTGASLEAIEPRADEVVLTVGNAADRNHQFLVNLERAHAGGSLVLDTGFVSVRDVQRERGEVAVEGIGTLELDAAERSGVHRIDVREVNAALRGLARSPLLAGFRYQRTTAPAPMLSMNVNRFAGAGVLAAIADRAVATTLVTSEGRTLTEVVLDVQNRAQPYLKVTLPRDATMVSAELAGEPVKPVLGTDGTRVPLLRAGLKPAGAYQVSFVYMHAGTPFSRKGDLAMTLPTLDIPIGIVEWEVFVPDSYNARVIDGNAIDARTVSHRLTGGLAGSADTSTRSAQKRVAGGRVLVTMASDALPGQIRGKVTDMQRVALPGVTIALATAAGTTTAMSSADGTFAVSGVPAGQVTVTATLAGFETQSTSFVFDERPRRVEFSMPVGAISETLTITGESPRVERADLPSPPSLNVVNLQRRTAGVLPIRVEIPLAGRSHQFVKPLVVGQEVTVTMRYKRK